VSTDSSMSRLDIAKMAVESVTKLLDRRCQDHNRQCQQLSSSAQQSLHNIGLGYCAPDQYLLLSTGRQYVKQASSAACGAGGRLLVGYGDYHDPNPQDQSHERQQSQPIHHNHGSFERELKRLRATEWEQLTDTPVASAVGGQRPKSRPFPEDGGGAVGLNAALSAGLQLLSRRRLINRSTENFGMGRLPSTAMIAPLNAGGGAGLGSGASAATNALQPACLVLLTDSECLTRPPAEGGGPLQLQFGNMPLREFYKEPFRWDQRTFCINVGGSKESSSQSLHPSLRAFCEVTGGCHTSLRSAAIIPQLAERLLQFISPPRPKQFPIPDPLRLPNLPASPTPQSDYGEDAGTFVNGGPVCCFQQLEGGIGGEQALLYRAQLLFIPYYQEANKNATIPQPPLFQIPESFFPSKKLDSLPPRSGQPLLNYSCHYQIVGSSSFDPIMVMNALHRLDQVTASNRQMTNVTNASGKQSSAKLLQRDVYICEFISQDGKRGISPRSQRGQEHLPVCVRGAGRQSLSEGEENFLNIGILHLPYNRAILSGQNESSSKNSQFCTLTLLPPEPHILLPLLVRAAEAEHRVLTKASESKDTSGAPGKQQGTVAAAARNVRLDEEWRSEFKAYLFRIPPYYQHALRRCLRPILPMSAQSLLPTESFDQIVSQCFSRLCLQKIRSGEKMAKENNERLVRQEEELRRRGVQLIELHSQEAQSSKQTPKVGYGQFDPHSSINSYLAALRNMPPPWRVGSVGPKRSKSTAESSDADAESMKVNNSEAVMTETLDDLPASCLLAYYESRRRWIFGGSGLTTRGLSVEGVNNDGTNSHFYSAKHTSDDESLLAVTGVGASTLNKTNIGHMGDFRERLLWSRAPVVGYGSNGSTGSAATTAADGSPTWSVDDNALPPTFFDLKTGEFCDSVQARVRSRLMINFGNPYKDKRGDSLIPEKFLGQRPPLHHENLDGSPPGSPPHDGYNASPVEGEGEAAFAGISRKATGKDDLHRKSSKRDVNPLQGNVDAKKRKTDSLPTNDEPRLSASPESKADSVHKADTTVVGETAKNAAVTSPPRKTRPSKPPPPPPLKGGEHQKRLPPPPPRPPPSKKPPPPPPPPKSQSSESRKGAPPPPPPSAKRKSLVPKHQQHKPQQQKQQPTPRPADVQSPNSKPKVDLPPGWMCVWSKSQKRWYFFDSKTNKSVWQWPPPGGIPR